MNDQIRHEPTPLLLLILPFAAGIVYSRGIDGLDRLDLIWIWLFILFCIFFFSIPFFLSREGNGFRITGLRLSCLIGSLILGFSLGVFHERETYQRISQNQRVLLSLADKGGEHVFTGLVLTAPVPVENACKTQMLVYATETPFGSHPVDEILAVTFGGVDWREIEPGTVVRFAARLRRVRNFKTPGSFDFENWWLIRKIMVRGWCSSGLKFVVGSKEDSLSPGLGVELFVQRLRHVIMREISCFFRDGGSRAVAMAVLTGERAWFQHDLRQGFGASGLGHILAVSGLHMAIIALFAAGVVRFFLGFSQWILLRFNVRIISYWSAVGACLVYTAIAGFSPSSLRAFFMVLVFGLSMLLNRPAALKNCLALAALILLLLSPFYLFDISFQLSFFIVFFLIHFYGLLKFSGGRPSRWFKELIAISCAAFVLASPLVAFYFQRFAFLAVPFNMAAVPLTEFAILPTLFLGLMFSWLLPGLPNPMWMCADWAMSCLVKLVQLSSQIQGINTHILPPSIAQLCILTALFLVLPLVTKRSFKNMAIVIAASFLMVTGYKIYKEANPNSLFFHVVDVGQGLCQVIQFPDGRTMVADAGGLNGFDVGGSVVAPYLRRLGIKRIDILAVSHAERDHIGGVPALLRQFQVGQLWLGQGTNPGLDAYWEVLRLAKEKAIPIRMWDHRLTLSIDRDLSLDVLPCQSCPGKMSRNARCLVLRIGFNGRHVLLTGDIDKWRERRVSTSGLLSSEIMVMPHHGSTSSSSKVFLHAVHPLIAICSCGYKNSFHLPSKKVLKRYERLGITVFRTDIDGTIDVRISREGEIKIATYLEGWIGL